MDMHADFFSQWNEIARASVDPFMRFNMVAASTMERLTREQFALLNDWAETGMKQLRMPSEVSGWQELYSRQMALTSEYLEKSIGHAQQSMQIVLQAQEEFGRMAEQGVKEAASKGEEMAAKGAQAAKATFSNVEGETKSATRPGSKPS
jgi:phasin family protein